MSPRPDPQASGTKRLPPIQTGTDTWIIMREYLQQPKAIVHRLTTTDGTPRYLLMTWEPISADRRLVSMHISLDEADAAVPWPDPNQANPYPGSGRSSAAYDEHFARQRATNERSERRSGKRTPVTPVPPEQAWG